jgi:quinol monooxygenase YgiN
MATIIIHHEVKDYDSWRQVFDNVEDLRRENGERSAQVFRDAGNPNLVSAVVTYDTVEAAQAWFGNDQLKAKMSEAGVVGKPDIRYLDPA